MAETELAVQTLLKTGITPTYGAANVDGHWFVNDGRTLIQLKNTNAATRTATFHAQNACDQGYEHDASCEVPITTGDKMCGPFPTSIFNDDEGKAHITFDAVTNLTIGAMTLG